MLLLLLLPLLLYIRWRTQFPTKENEEGVWPITLAWQPARWEGNRQCKSDYGVTIIIIVIIIIVIIITIIIISLFSALRNFDIRKSQSHPWKITFWAGNHDHFGVTETRIWWFWEKKIPFKTGNKSRYQSKLCLALFFIPVESDL